MCTGAKELRFILSDYSFKEKGIKPDFNYSVKSFNFPMRYWLYPPASLFMTSKVYYV